MAYILARLPYVNTIYVLLFNGVPNPYILLETLKTLAAIINAMGNIPRDDIWKWIEISEVYLNHFHVLMCTFDIIQVHGVTVRLCCICYVLQNR